MPETQAPPRLPLVTLPENRDSTAAKDAKMVNCYAEKTAEGEYEIYKRPGLLVNATKSGNGLGAYNWLGDTYYIFGTLLYKNGTSIGTVDSTNGVYRFSQSLGATPRLVLGNGVKAYTWDNTTLAQITDVDFPSTFVKGWAYLDATTYVMQTTAKIQGSDINNPPSWDPLNFLIAQVEPDQGVALMKQLVYVIAFKQWTTEVFYDAANSTGSPLGTVQGAKMNFGCAHQDSIQNIDDVIFWLATNRSSQLQVAAVSQLKPEIVSTKPVERLLKGLDLTTIFSWQFKDEGHSFYVLTSKVSNLTLAFDLTERNWYQWYDVNGNYMPIVASTYNSSMQHLVQHETNGNIYLMDRTYTNDDGAIITTDLVTPNYDGKTRRNKTLNFMDFIADQTPGSILLVRNSDDDYQTWTNWRRVDLSKKRPFLDNCGTFRKRAYNFRHQSNTKLRIKAVEMQIELGTL